MVAVLHNFFKAADACFILKRLTYINILVMVVPFLISSASAAKEYKFYKGAVVEFAPDKWDGSERPETLLLRNARRYKKVIEEASKENCDIIVFPESGITSLSIPAERHKMYPFLTFIPDVEEHAIPCQEKKTEFAEHLREISCAAKQHGLYVVINLEEKKKCDTTQAGCPTDGLLFYNTNLVFDREGKIISKYHKYNLFREPEINVTSSPEHVTFDTDFGVTFGMFVCFDILFNEPAYALVKKPGVKNIVYSTAWFSELPFLTATEIQSGFSYLNNVNFLASGYSQPEFSSGGSGIYSGSQGSLVSIMPEKATTKILIATIPKDPDHHKLAINHCHTSISCINNAEVSLSHNSKIVEVDFEYNSRAVGLTFFHEDLTDFTTEILETNEVTDSNNNEQTQNFIYTHNEFTCKIKVNWTKENPYSSNGPVYRFIGFSGDRSYMRIRTVKLEVCGVIACQTEDVKTCGFRPNFETGDLTLISSILINTTSSRISNSIPSTLNKDILALVGTDLSFSNTVDEHTGIQSNFMVLEKPHNDLITFGIYKS